MTSGMAPRTSPAISIPDIANIDIFRVLGKTLCLQRLSVKAKSLCVVTDRAEI